MQPAAAGNDSGGSAALKRYGPLGILVAIAAVVAFFVLTSGGDDETSGDTTAPESTATEGTTGDGDDPDTTGDTTDGTPGESSLPEGVMTFDEATRLGIADDIDWGERCDLETGRVKVADFFGPACFQPWDGSDNGGETDAGVTGDAITIVYYVAQENDPVLAYITDAIANDDTNAEITETMENLLPYYETYYETYGRSVELIVYEATGIATNDIAARADAVQIAEQYEPFMVWGGPALVGSFQEELMARGIACMACGPSQTKEWYEENSPNAWAIGMGGRQSNFLTAEYLGKRLAGRNAIHAGDEAYHDTERVFGRLFVTSTTAGEAHEEFVEDLAGYGVEFAVAEEFALDPTTIAEQADNIIAKLKAAGVTTVVMDTDPVSPRDFTRAATDQEYFPEWIVSAFLTDTNVFARTYDQEQWANAFGATARSLPVDQSLSGANFKYEWYWGEPAAADDTIPVMDPFPATFYAVISGVGPDLTMENFEAAIFAAEPTRRAITAPSLSWGRDGRWEPAERFEPDYLGTDDFTELWWDPDQVGIDELGEEGPGMYWQPEGGKRYLPGEWPDTDPNVFTTEGALDFLTERPADEATPSNYEPITTLQGG
jgi:hypothetical protein